VEGVCGALSSASWICREEEPPVRLKGVGSFRRLALSTFVKESDPRKALPWDHVVVESDESCLLHLISRHLKRFLERRYPWNSKDLLSGGDPNRVANRSQLDTIGLFTFLRSFNHDKILSWFTFC